MKGSFGNTLPIQGSDIAASWDTLYIFLVLMSLFFFVGVVGAMIVFSLKFRRGRPGKTKYLHGHVRLEIIWTVVPTFLVLGIFAWGWMVYKDMVQSPPNAREIRVIGKQWSWQFVYDNGRSLTNELYVPLHEPVKLIMTSEDVLHSFFIPAFRVKQDVVPGMYTTVWFEASVPGEHDVYCAEYCGAAHSGMLAKIHALSPDVFERWMRGGKIELAQANGEGNAADTSDALGESQAKPISLANQGEKLASIKGCVACHSANGTSGIGPSYKGRFGTMVKLMDGSQVKMDENYIRESLMNPQAKIVEGFSPVMPTFQGQLTASETTAIIEYIKSLK